MKKKKNKIVTVLDMPQPIADQAEGLLQQFFDLVYPYRVIVGSPEEVKSFLKLSSEGAVVCAALNDVINDFPNVFGSAFPKASFQSAQENIRRNRPLFELLEQSLGIIELRRQGLNHNRKQGLIQALPIVNQAVENGMTEFDSILESLNEIWSKTLHTVTVFSISANEQIIVENVKGGTMITNSGQTSLNLLIGINESGEWIEILPKTEYDLPKKCRVITIKNLSATIRGEFRVRILSID